MSTREREVRTVMDALAKELRCSVDSRTSAALAAYDCLTTDEHDALLAEGSASSEGAEAEMRTFAQRLAEAQKPFDPDVAKAIRDNWRKLFDDDTSPQPAQGEREQRSCEGSELRPIADEDRAACDFIFDFNERFGSVILGGPHVHAMRDALRARESALPRGLPAGSDAAVSGWPAIDRGTPESNEELREKLGDMLGIGIAARTNSTILSNVANVMRFADMLAAVEREFFMVPGEVDDDAPDEEPAPECLLNSWGSTTAEYIEQFRAALGAMSATAEQPSCGQDARDAARWRKAVELAIEDSAGWTIPHETDVYSFDERIDAAIGAENQRTIAAQQRQGGAKEDRT